MIDYEFDKDLLAKIEQNLDLLDESILEFLKSIFTEFPSEKEIFTMGAFITKLFDSDWNIFYKQLESEGFLKWSYLEYFNHQYSSKARDYVAIWLYRLNYHAKRGDYKNQNLLGNITECTYNADFIGDDCDGGLVNNKALTTAVIDCPVYLEKVIPGYSGDLYTAVLVDDERFRKAVKRYLGSRKHVYIAKDANGNLSSARYPYQEYGIIWTPIKNIENNLFSGYGLTALPREILEKYNLPIEDNITYFDIKWE